MTRVLGVDLGSRRIGLAVSDPLGLVASPHDVLARQEELSADHRAILDVAREVEATVIVVGLPRSLSGRDGPAARSALDEVEALRSLADDDVDVATYDERFTTTIAERSLRESGMRRDARRKVVDKVAAAVMLQSYLDAQVQPP